MTRRQRRRRQLRKKHGAGGTPGNAQELATPCNWQRPANGNAITLINSSINQPIHVA